MQQIVDWVRQITFFLIFMTLFDQLIPDKKYRRYVRFFASLVLVILTVNPLLLLFDIEKQLYFQQDVFAYPQEVEEFRLRAQQAQGQQFEDILEAYRETVKDHLEVMAAQQGLYVRDSIVTLAGQEDCFGQVTEVDMTVTYRRLGRGDEEQVASREEMDGMRELSQIREITVERVELDSGPGQSLSGVDDSDADQGNVDVQELKTQIMQLYQLGPEQVSVRLEE